MATATQAPPTQVMQGIDVPASSVNPAAFFRATRRLTFAMKSGAFAGFGLTDNIGVLQTGIIGQLVLRASGSITATPGTGTIATTARWPYDVIRSLRLSANGQSNLINVSGAKLKARDVMSRGDLIDRGQNGIGGAQPGTSVRSGTMSLNSEFWGFGSNATGLGAGTYDVDLVFPIPVAYDQVNLMGAIFAQTSATDLNVAVDWAPLTDLFVLTGNAAVAGSLSFQLMGTVYSIPQGPNGDVIVPDLSVFHSLIQSRYLPTGGLNEIRLAGQGVGRQLLRVFWQTWNGSPSAPLPIVDANFGQLGWRFGGNDTPENMPALGASTRAHLMRYNVERTFASDLGGPNGFACLDFCNENAFRDTVDEGAATELRLLNEIQAGVALTNPVVEYVQETAFAGPVGA